MPLRFSPARGAAVVISASSRGLTGATGTAATIAAGTTTTGAEGTSAAVANSGSSSAATFDFTIPRGAVPAIGFNFDTSTTDADPGAGDVRFNNATPASVTAIYFDNADRDGNTITSWLDAWDDITTNAKGVLVITPAATPSAKLIYNVTGSVVDGTGYRKVTVAHVAGTTLPSSGAHLAIQFVHRGDIGALGFKQTYSSTTADADPGAGIFRLNNATPASATAAYLDNTDLSGTTVSGIMDLWDDSTNTVRGSLHAQSINDNGIWGVWEVTGSVVDGTGYRKLTLQNGQAAGSFSGVFSIWFNRAGNKGTDGLGTGDVVGPASSVDGEAALFDSTTGKLIKRATGTGVGVLTSGVLAAQNEATFKSNFNLEAGTDFAAPGANADITSVYLNNTGLKVKDTNASHGLTLKPGSDLSADKTLTLTTGDADRTLTITSDATIPPAAASTSASGIVELATDAEMQTGTDSARVPSVQAVRNGTGAGWASFAAHKNGTDQTLIADVTVTDVTFGTEVYDVGGFFASNTWTPPAGKVNLSAGFFGTATIAAGNSVAIIIAKNGSPIKQGSWAAGTNTFAAAIATDDIANGTDAYKLQIYIDVTSGTGTIVGTAYLTFFAGHMIN